LIVTRIGAVGENVVWFAKKWCDSGKGLSKPEETFSRIVRVPAIDQGTPVPGRHPGWPDIKSRGDYGINVTRVSFRMKLCIPPRPWINLVATGASGLGLITKHGSTTGIIVS
jgi:hypothetical protein